MRHDPQDCDEAPRRAAAGADDGAFGPQGAALILELQRLRRAFEDESHGEPAVEKAARQPRRPSGLAKPARAAKPKRRRKSRMGRAIDVCLGQLGFRKTDATGRVTKARAKTPVTAVNRRSVSIVPDQEVLIRSTRLGPEDLRSGHSEASMALESPGSKSTGRDPQIVMGRAIRSCTIGLRSAVGFLLDRNAANRPDESTEDLTVRTGRSFENELRTGLRVLVVAALLGGGWLALVPLAGAVVVPGNLVVQSNVKSIQHPSGGVVAEIKVSNGRRVAAGDLLLRLDATQVQANLQMVKKQLDELRGRIGRLSAERDGLDRPQVHPELAAHAAEPNVKSVLASEEALFAARLNARTSQKDILQGKIGQLGQEVSGLEAQVQSKAKQLELIAGELTGVQELYDKRLVPLARLTALQRETARIEGERGQLISAIAETKSKIGEAQLQIVRLDQDFRTDVVKELGETQGKEAELVERKVAAHDQLERIEIRAPTSGVIHQLSVHTIGGVIRAGDTIMEVVPDTDDLQIEARLQPKDIDHVRPGQTAFVRFSAFNQRTTPQLVGSVSFVSADTSRDQQTNAPYFTVRIVLPDEERRRLGGLQLVPGMPAEVFMQTGSRTMMSYLLKPITEQMHRAFVEQ
jgi:HlyD family secretion protein